MHPAMDSPSAVYHHPRLIHEATLMANEIRAIANPGSTVYARVMNSVGQWWNGSTFEAYAAANWSTYRVALTEQGSSGVFTANFPSGITAGGTYEYYTHLQSGGSAAEGDQAIGTGTVDWTGTAAVTAGAGSMTGSDFYAYVLRKGFKRTDKSTELYEAITDAIQIMRRRYNFSEAETEATSTDTISVLGDFKLAIESLLGFLIGIVVEDGTDASPLEKVSKQEFDRLYPDINVTSNKGYPKHYCIFGDQVYIGPIPDSTSYVYRLAYSRRAGAIVSSTSGVPFTNFYRDVLADLVQALAYDGLEEYDKADRHFQRFEAGFFDAKRLERINKGETCFNMESRDL
jgi:hypothetical protein